MPLHSRRRATALAGGSAIAALLGVLFTYDSTRRSTTAVLAELAVAGGIRPIQPRLSIDFPHASFVAASTVGRAAALKDNYPALLSRVLSSSGHEGLRHLLLGDVEKAVQ